MKELSVIFMIVVALCTICFLAMTVWISHLEEDCALTGGTLMKAPLTGWVCIAAKELKP